MYDQTQGSDPVFFLLYKITLFNVRSTLDEGPMSRDQWIQAILLVESFKSVSRPLGEGPRPKSGKLTWVCVCTMCLTQDISLINLININLICTKSNSSNRVPQLLHSYLVSKMQNLASISIVFIGETINARLISYARSFTNLKNIMCINYTNIRLKNHLFRFFFNLQS